MCENRERNACNPIEKTHKLKKTGENHTCAKRASLLENTCKYTMITECRKTNKNGQKKHGKTWKNDQK